MTQHYTKNTVSASGWCAKCRKMTQHRIDDRRMGPCLDCIAKLVENLEKAAAAKVRKKGDAERQGGFVFGKVEE